MTLADAGSKVLDQLALQSQATFDPVRNVEYASKYSNPLLHVYLRTALWGWSGPLMPKQPIPNHRANEHAPNCCPWTMERVKLSTALNENNSWYVCNVATVSPSVVLPKNNSSCLDAKLFRFICVRVVKALAILCVCKAHLVCLSLRSLSHKLTQQINSIIIFYFIFSSRKLH